MWDKLKTLNEGDPIVKIVELDGYRVRYEILKMEDSERIATFMKRVNEIAMGIQCCEGSMSKDERVSKVLRALPADYKMKATTINELRTMSNTSVNRDILIGNYLLLSLKNLDPLDLQSLNLLFMHHHLPVKVIGNPYMKNNWKI